MQEQELLQCSPKERLDSAVAKDRVLNEGSKTGGGSEATGGGEVGGGGG